MKILPIVLAVLAVATAIPAWFVDKAPNVVPELEDKYIGIELEFADAAEVRSLGDDVGKIRVVTWDKAETTMIEVVQKDGAWQIASRLDYPADGANKVGETAGQVLGLRKLRLVTDDTAAHVKLGVVDPLDSNADDEGRGQRATLWDGGDKVLVDVIIGGMVDDSPGQRYVREADSAAVYTAQVSGSLSAKFIDWVEPNPFDLEADHVLRAMVENYSIDETAGTQEMRFQAVLKRNDKDANWTSDQTPGDKVVDDGAIDSIVGKVADLRLANVAMRRGLGAAQLSQLGIFVTEQGVFGNEGVLRLSSNLGYTYHLFFGEVTGSATSTGDDSASADADRIMAVWVSYAEQDDTSLPVVAPESAPPAEGEEVNAEAAKQAAAKRAQQLKQRAEHVASRQKTVEQLNVKYADYFYVIRDADFQALRPEAGKLFTDPPKEDDAAADE
ncbi:MAG: DUF4340 domain-containing protein [Planctomycetota bacterium]|jgi:hypothetical protein|nr:DUF4340 domain-containing protein [Planctomycetota bacterium]